MIEKTCSKCKETKLESLFYIYRSRSKSYRRSWCKACDNRATKIKQRQLKQQAVEYLGGECENCGYDRCLRALQFHHKDPTKKDITISKYRSLSFEKIRPELDKCRLLCSNCHTEEHEGPKLEELIEVDNSLKN